MKPILFKLAVLSLLLAISSCNKVIDLKLRDQSGSLVIEGNITDSAGPQIIKLSTNVSLANANAYPPVTGAAVSVTDDDGKNYTFAEDKAGSYFNNDLAGIPGHTYTMHVLSNGKAYTATSTMPQQVLLDSLTTKSDAFNPKNNKEQVAVHFADPAGVVNQYRFVMFVNSVQVNTVFAFNDDFTNGRNVSLDLFQNDKDILPGDSLRLEMQCIDKPIYTYWFTLSQQTVNGPGGGVTPSNPPTNISPVALGYFSAHTTQTVSILIK